MKKVEMNRTFLASDIYMKWRKIVKKAASDIEIFTPFFDNTLNTLLRANTAVAQDRKVIITDISSENALEMPYQLRAAKRALSQGITILSLQGLHAKVLLADGKQASVGSQNFTSRGQKNREASVVPEPELSGSKFVEVLRQWREAAREVTEDEIDELLKQLAPYFQKHKSLHEAIQSEVNRVVTKHVAKREANAREKLREIEEIEKQKNVLLREHLQDLVRKSNLRLAKRTIYAIVKERSGCEALYGDDDFTNWETKNSNGAFSPFALKRLHFYPIILADTNRMGFARIAKTRITYIRSGAGWGSSSWKVGDVNAKVSVSFPATGTESQNIKFSIETNSHQGSCTFAVSFNGIHTSVVERHFIRGSLATESSYKTFVSNIEHDILNSNSSLDVFVKAFLKPFPKFDRLDRDRKNAIEFFDYYGWYAISLVQVHGNPLLVFKTC